MEFNFQKIVIGALILFLGLSFFTFAEAAYPNLPGVGAPGEDATFPELIPYFFGLLLWVGTILVAASLIYAGILYLISRGNRALISKAKDRAIYSAFGLLILLSSFLLLRTISPQFVDYPWVEPATSSPPSLDIPDPDPEAATTTFQEIPIGTLTEKLLAKDIDCYNEDEEMVDCQDGKVVDTLVNDKDARRGYCYDFKEEDGISKFKDADSDTEQIDPMTEHDRFDCLIKFEEPVNEKMQKLEKWANKIVKLTSNCSTKHCEVDGECIDGNCANTSCREGTCQPLESCLGQPYDSGRDPCPGRSQIDEYRKKIRRNYKDDKLKELTVDEFNERAIDDPDEYNGNGDPLLVADQVRFLMLNFLEPLQEDLEKDLSYLRKSEDFLEGECAYQTITSLATHYNWKENQNVNWEEKSFCETNSGASWGENCSKQDQTDITKFCKEFNAPSCETEEEEKLPCYECNLDKLGQGDCATSTIGEREVKTCKPEEYVLNNEFGSSTCTTTNATCTMCKVENENSGETPEETCEKYTSDSATFYCPDPDSEKVPKDLSTIISGGTIDPEPDNRYPRGAIPIGHTVDDTELLGQEIIEKLDKINQEIKNATEALFNPEDPAGELEDEPQGDLSVLYVLPLSCRCQNNPDDYWGEYHSEAYCDVVGQAGCCEPYACNCDDEGCDTCCSYQYDVCECKCKIENPCLMDKIEKKHGTVKDAKFFIEEKGFPRIRNLVEVKNLEKEDPDRHELITMLTQSREKLRNCVTGFERVEKDKMRIRAILNCTEAWNMLKTKQISINPKFPIPNYENCYPPEFPLSEYQHVGNCYPYNSIDNLSEDQMEACLNDINGTECRQAINSIGQNGGMDNFFCANRVIKD